MSLDVSSQRDAVNVPRAVPSVVWLAPQLEEYRSPGENVLSRVHAQRLRSYPDTPAGPCTARRLKAADRPTSRALLSSAGTAPWTRSADTARSARRSRDDAGSIPCTSPAEPEVPAIGFPRSRCRLCPPGEPGQGRPRRSWAALLQNPDDG